MLLKILGRVLGTIATIMVFAVIRLMLFASMLHPHPRAGSAPAAGLQAVDQGAGTLAAADHSSWIVFDTPDPATGLRTRHARLTGFPAGTLELTRSGTDQHAIFSLPPPTACATIAALSAEFDKHAVRLAVKAEATSSACRLEIVDYGGALQSLRDSDGLTIHPDARTTISFSVAGLAWD